MHADAKALFEDRVELVLSEPRDAVYVEADASRLAQMLGNLPLDRLEMLLSQAARRRR